MSETETVEFGRIEDMLAEAHAIGYRKGVEDAARLAQIQIQGRTDEGEWQSAWETCAEVTRNAILALLEQTSDSNRPHLEIGAVPKSKT